MLKGKIQKVGNLISIAIYDEYDNLVFEALGPDMLKAKDKALSDVRLLIKRRENHFHEAESRLQEAKDIFYLLNSNNLD